MTQSCSCGSKDKTVKHLATETPTSEMNLWHFVKEAQDVQTQLTDAVYTIYMEVIRGKELQDLGCVGLIWENYLLKSAEGRWG